MIKIRNAFSKYKYLWLIFLSGLVGSYIAIILLEKIYPGIRLILFISMPVVYGLLKVKNEKIIVLLVSFFIGAILSLISL